MVAPTFDISKSSAAKATGANGEGLRYRLDVVAASAADVVQSAGGWLYDRAMAGWEVTVLLPRGCDTRSLRILGVRVADLEPELAQLGAGTASLAVSAEAFTADPRVRGAVLESLNNRVTEVALWGDGWPLGVNRATARAQHLLSGAARMFKGYALAAEGIPGATVHATEALLCDVGSGTDSELIRLD
ncbi:hypothetical protein MMAN_37590 [Mycobacterium mantenii]|uniref:Uncharacterized protein n=1 Tax=Mycobacterium mantenii TaxID=560555 RepID=A0A1X0FXV3_MYCNT|nr:hypothetical protein [Mycobacterium mantenii]MCV7245561.1 hypothetical protein [Mycobacterium mantenii]ORB06622.1 hypothetical protein BST30_09330 [Mycobacterium mantenii]BBY39625.1 hypothetical protein MMAN_37590 [Mycobacterium mantenii]